MLLNKHQYIIMKAYKNPMIEENNNKINLNDDIVIHNINGKNIGWHILNEKNKNEMKNIIDNDSKNINDKKYRIVYQRIPNKEKNIIVIKDNIGIQQDYKMKLSKNAINAIEKILSNMFSETKNINKNIIKYYLKNKKALEININKERKDLIKCKKEKCLKEYKDILFAEKESTKKLQANFNTLIEKLINNKITYEDFFIKLNETSDNNFISYEELQKCIFTNCNKELFAIVKKRLDRLLFLYPNNKKLNIIKERINKNKVNKNDNSVLQNFANNNKVQ